MKRGVADHCCDLVPRKKGRPARNDPRFRPKYRHSGTTTTTSNNGDDHNHNTANITNNTNASTPSTLGTSDSDMETPSSRHLSDGLSSGSERDSYHHHQHHQHHQHHHMYDQHIDDLPYTDYDDDDDEEEEESEEEARRRRHWGQRRDEPAERPRAAESPSDLASRVIAMMADEMHKLRKENAKLRCKVKKLRKHKRAREEEEEEPNTNTNYNHHSHNNHNRSTCAPGSTNPKRPRYDEAPAMAAAPQPQLRPVETQPSAVAAGECVGLMEARKHMPFLNHYRMSADVPLVVGDISAYGHVLSSLVFMGLIADR